MIQELINRLDEAFPGTAIYMDDVSQGAKLPAFFVQVVDVSLVREFRGRYWYRVLFSVTYVPKKEPDPNRPGFFKPLDGRELLVLTDQLNTLLWTLEELSPRRRATEIEGRMVDEAAQVVVGYQQMMEKQWLRTEYMEMLRHEFEVRRG